MKRRIEELENEALTKLPTYNVERILILSILEVARQLEQFNNNFIDLKEFIKRK